MIKNIFVYGTLKQGERNHKYFQDKVVDIVPGTIKGTICHLVDFNCPGIILGQGTIGGQVIHYNDDQNNTIEQNIDELEQTDELFYDRIEVDVTTASGVIKSQVYIPRDIENLNVKIIDNEWNE